MRERRFPPPWPVEDNGSCFIVLDHKRQALAYVYYEEEAGRRSAAQLLTSDEARRIAANIQGAGLATRAANCRRLGNNGVTSKLRIGDRPCTERRARKSTAWTAMRFTT